MKRALKGKNASNEWLAEFQLCAEMGWSYEELQNTPEEIVVAFSRIMSIKARHEELELKDIERRMKK